MQSVGYIQKYGSTVVISEKKNKKKNHKKTKLDEHEKTQHSLKKVFS